MEEGRAINVSLSALGDVISALQRRRPHVPYRYYFVVCIFPTWDDWYIRDNFLMILQIGSLTGVSFSCRNSKLTQILRDSLGKIAGFEFDLPSRNLKPYFLSREGERGLWMLLVTDNWLLVSGDRSAGEDSKTLMLVHVSPKEVDLGETICSLSFATRARGTHLEQEISEVLLCNRSCTFRHVLLCNRSYPKPCQCPCGLELRDT